MPFADPKKRREYKRQWRAARRAQHRPAILAPVVTPPIQARPQQWATATPKPIAPIHAAQAASLSPSRLNAAPQIAPNVSRVPVEMSAYGLPSPSAVAIQAVLWAATFVVAGIVVFRFLFPKGTDVVSSFCNDAIAEPLRTWPEWIPKTRL